VNARKERDGAAAASSTTFAPLPDIGTSVDLPAVLRMTKAEYKRWFKSTSMAWRGKAVLQRNAAVALGNSRDAGAVPPLIEALSDRKPLVRGHAAWALGQLGALSGAAARDALENLRSGENVEWVREEIDFALTRLNVDAE
jgi:epoxyqueuosine reductase